MITHIGPTVEEQEPSIKRFEGLHTKLVHALAVLPDKQRMVSAGEDGRLLCWSIETGEILMELKGHKGPINHLALFGGYLATAGDDRTVRIWDVPGGFEPRFVLEGHGRYVRQVALSKELVVSVCEDAIVRVWRLSDGQLLHELTGHQESIQAVGLSPDGRLAVTASLEQAVLVWDIQRGEPLQPVYNAKAWVRHLGIGGLHMGGKNHTGVGHVEQTPVQIHFLDSERLLTASDGMIIWDFAARKERARVDNFAWGVSSVAFDETRIFLGTHTEIRGISGDETIFRCAAPKSGARALCLVDDRLVVGGGEGAIEIIEVRGWMPEERHISGAQQALITPDGERVATMDDDAELRLWDLDRGEALAVFNRHPEPNPQPFALSPDGRLLATTRSNGAPAICLWDSYSGALLQTLHAEEPGRRSILSLMFVDGQLLVGPLGEDALQLWSLAPDGPDAARITRFETSTKQISSLARIKDTIITEGYFEPAEPSEERSAARRESIAHLQGWSLSARALLWTRPSSKPEGAKRGCFFGALHDLDGRLLTGSGSSNHELALFEPTTGELLKRWTLSMSVVSTAISAGSIYAQLADQDAEQRALVKLGPDGDLMPPVPLPWTARHVQIAASAERIAWSEEQTLVIASLKTGEPLQQVALDQPLTALALRPDGQRALVCLRSGRVRMYLIE